MVRSFNEHQFPGHLRGGHLGFLEKKERGDRVMVFFAPRSGRDEQVSSGPLGTPGHDSAGKSAQFIPFVWVPNSLGFLQVPGGRLPSSSTHTEHLVSGVGSSLKIPTTNWRTGPILEARAW